MSVDSVPVYSAFQRSFLTPTSLFFFIGETYHLVDHSLPIERIGFLEETYHTFSYSPFRGNNGDIIGIINISFECADTPFLSPSSLHSHIGSLHLA